MPNVRAILRRQHVPIQPGLLQQVGIPGVDGLVGTGIGHGHVVLRTGLDRFGSLVVVGYGGNGHVGVGVGGLGVGADPVVDGDLLVLSVIVLGASTVTICGVCQLSSVKVRVSGSAVIPP